MRALRGPRAVQSVKQYNFINEYRELSINEEQLGCRDDDNESCVSRWKTYQFIFPYDIIPILPPIIDSNSKINWNPIPQLGQQNT